MNGVLYDLELTLQTAHEIISNHDPNLAFDLVECDIFAPDASFGSQLDLILLSNIIHIVGPDQNVRLFQNIRSALKTNGRLVIQDFLLDDSSTA
ncbi:class I SAM-dependent methyltransferase, partial [Arthrospira platensis SPKY2]